MQADITSSVVMGATTYFARPDALQGTLLETLLWARPTAFFAVPRIWEKMEDKFKEKAAEAPEWVRKFTGWAKDLGYKKVMA